MNGGPAANEAPAPQRRFWENRFYRAYAIASLIAAPFLSFWKIIQFLWHPDVNVASAGHYFLHLLHAGYYGFAALGMYAFGMTVPAAIKVWFFAKSKERYWIFLFGIPMFFVVNSTIDRMDDRNGWYFISFLGGLAFSALLCVMLKNLYDKLKG